MSIYLPSLSPDEIYHHGILGQKWGKRNGPPYPLGASDHSAAEKKAYKIHKDGSIEIEKGATLQRLINSKDNNSSNLNGAKYVSFTNNDNASYIKNIGGKGLLGGGRDTRYILTAKTKLRSPSIDHATKELLHVLKDNKEARKSFEDTPLVGYKISEKQLDRMINNPTSKEARALYTSAVSSFALSTGKPLRDAFFTKLSRQNYNMIRDENDVAAGYAKNPLILFNAEKAAFVQTSQIIDKNMRLDAKETVKNAKRGRQELQKIGIIPLE